MLHCQLGRFISRDPIGYVAGSNSFQFVGSRVVSAVDPSGAVPQGPDDDLMKWLISLDQGSAGSLDDSKCAISLSGLPADFERFQPNPPLPGHFPPPNTDTTYRLHIGYQITQINSRKIDVAARATSWVNALNLFSGVFGPIHRPVHAHSRGAAECRWVPSCDKCQIAVHSEGPHQQSDGFKHGDQSISIGAGAQVAAQINDDGAGASFLIDVKAIVGGRVVSGSQTDIGIELPGGIKVGDSLKFEYDYGFSDSIQKSEEVNVRCVKKNPS